MKPFGWRDRAVIATANWLLRHFLSKRCGLVMRGVILRGMADVESARAKGSEEA